MLECEWRKHGLRVLEGVELILGGEAVGEEVLLEVGHLVEVVAVLLEMEDLFQLYNDLEEVMGEGREVYVLT